MNYVDHIQVNIFLGRNFVHAISPGLIICLIPGLLGQEARKTVVINTGVCVYMATNSWELADIQ